MQEEKINEFYFPSVNDYELVVDNARVNVYVPTRGDSGDNLADEQRYKYVLHNHTYSEIFACESEGIEITTEYGTLVLSSGDIAVIPIGVPHTMVYMGEDSSVGAAFGIKIIPVSKNGKSNILQLYRPMLQSKKPLIYRNHLKLALDMLKIRDTAKSPDSPIPVLSALVVLESLLSETVEIPGNDPSDYSAPDPRDPDRNRYVILDEIINGCFHKPIKPDDVSQKMYLSRRQFDRIVMKRYGKSFGAIINERRLDLAVRYLVSTDIPIDGIVERIGVSSKASFTRLFKEQYGVTPNAYRKQYKVKE